MLDVTIFVLRARLSSHPDAQLDCMASFVSRKVTEFHVVLANGTSSVINEECCPFLMKVRYSFS